MKIKTAVAILLLAIFAMSSITIIQIKPVYALPTLTLSDTEMYNEFAWSYGPGSLTGKTDVAGPGVKFDFTGLSPSSGTMVSDNHPVSSSAGGAIYYGHYSDFTGYSYYSMLFINAGSSSIVVNLFMNTGYTSSGDWGTRDWHYDAFWGSNWVTIGPHESQIVTLDFSNAEGYNLQDDPDPAYSTPPYYNGGHYAIYRLNEVTNIGFQVQGSGAGSVIASGTLTHLYIDPPEVTKTFGQVGSTFDVNVMLSSFANLAGFDIKLTWDDSLLTETAVDYTTALDLLWGASNWFVISETSGAGYYRLAVTALGTSAGNTGVSALFKLTFQVKDKIGSVPLSTPITFDVHQLADNSVPSQPITATVTNGLYTYIVKPVPDLEFKVKVKNRLTDIYEYKDPPYVLEYCRWVEVEVWVTDIPVSSPLTEYYLVIVYNPESIRFDKVDYWSAFGTGLAIDSPTGTITVTCTGGPLSGNAFLLFALTFHVEFITTPAHIWKYGQTNYLTNSISISDATLTFGTQGTIPKSGITMPSALAFEVDFIRGDVDCNGLVTIADIYDLGTWYGHPAIDKPEFDLNNDDTIDIYDIVTAATNYGYPTGIP